MKTELKEAEAFFHALFCGSHRCPPIKPFGDGWIVSTEPSRFATFDFERLTALVFLAHDMCMRAELQHGGPGRVRIAVWQRRTREGHNWERHPTIEQALALWRRTHPDPELSGVACAQQ